MTFLFGLTILFVERVKSCFFLLCVFPVEIHLLMQIFEGNSMLTPGKGEELDYMASVLTAGGEQYEETDIFHF